MQHTTTVGKSKSHSKNRESCTRFLFLTHVCVPHVVCDLNMLDVLANSLTNWIATECRKSTHRALPDDLRRITVIDPLILP